MKGTAQNQEQADSSEQQGAEHLPKVKPQELVIETFAQPPKNYFSQPPHSIPLSPYAPQKTSGSCV